MNGSLIAKLITIGPWSTSKTLPQWLLLFRDWSAVGCAMESTGYVMVSLVVIILACMAIFVGTYATELIGTLPVR